MARKYFILFCLLPLLHACSLAVYKPPVEGPSATVTFTAKTKYCTKDYKGCGILVGIWECKTRLNGYISIKGPEELGKEIVVQANKELFIDSLIFITKTGLSFNASHLFSFIPEAGGDYRVTFVDGTVELNHLMVFNFDHETISVNVEQVDGATGNMKRVAVSTTQADGFGRGKSWPGCD